MLQLNDHVLDTTWMRWLRRINRQTPKHFCSDTQRRPPRIKGKSDWSRRAYNLRWAQHYAVRNGKVTLLSRNHKPTPNSKVELIKDFKALECKESYDDLFGNGCTFKRRDLELPDHLKTVGAYLLNFNAPRKAPVQTTGNLFDYLVTTSRYLQILFNVPAYEVMMGYDELYGKYGQENPNARYWNSATFMHITVYGNEAKYISPDEQSKNRTIAFWLFENHIVFSIMTGIDTW